MTLDQERSPWILTLKSPTLFISLQYFTTMNENMSIQKQKKKGKKEMKLNKKNPKK